MKSRAARGLHTVKRPELPLGWHLSRSALLGLFLVTRATPTALRGIDVVFRDRERLLEALDRAVLSIDDTVRVGARITTAGRFLAMECVPAAYRDELTFPLTAAHLKKILSWVTRDLHIEIAARSAEALEMLGCAYADRSGLSPTRADFAPARETAEIVAEGVTCVLEIRSRYDEGLITDGERYNHSVDMWAGVADQSRSASTRRQAPYDDALQAICATDPDLPSPEHLRGILGLRAKPSGEIFDAAIVHSCAQGLSAHEYMMTCMSARGAIAAGDERDRVVATLLHDLAMALSDTTIALRDCGTTQGARVASVMHGFETMISLAERIEGRVAAADVVARDGSVLAVAGALLTRSVAKKIDKANVPWVLVRDARTCEAKDNNVCAACFGLDPDDATWPCDGDEIGTRAAFTIARELRSFSRSWFHIC